MFGTCLQDFFFYSKAETVCVCVFLSKGVIICNYSGSVFTHSLCYELILDQAAAVKGGGGEKNGHVYT